MMKVKTVKMIVSIILVLFMLLLLYSSTASLYYAYGGAGDYGDKVFAMSWGIFALLTCVGGGMAIWKYWKAQA